MEVAHPQSGSSSTLFLIELEFGNVGFWGEGKPGVPGEKHLGAKERTNNKLNPQMASTMGFEPRPHWWEASTLTTAPSIASPVNPQKGPVWSPRTGRFSFGYTRRIVSIPSGGTQQSFIQGGSTPRSDPKPFYIKFLTEKVPFSYTFYWKMVPLSHTLFRPFNPF